MRKAAVLWAFCLFISAARADTATDESRLGRTVWSAFECATYAEIAGYKEEQARLFTVGVRAGREFIAAAEKHPMSDRDSNVPAGILALLHGPSVDFILGRIFENAMADAFGSIVGRRPRVSLRAPAKLTKGELNKTAAQGRYDSSNCMLID